MCVCACACACVCARERARTRQCSLLSSVKRVSELSILFDRQVRKGGREGGRGEEKSEVARWGGGFKEAAREGE